MKYKLIFGLVLLVPVLSFVLQNDQTVTIVLFKWQFSSPLPLLVLAAVLVGVVLGVLAGISRKLRKSRLEKRAEKTGHKPEPQAASQPAQQPVQEPEPAAYRTETGDPLASPPEEQPAADDSGSPG